VGVGFKLVLFIFLFTLVSCECSNTSTSIIKKKNANGVVLEEGITINGKREGISRLYYDNGSIKEIGYWKNDLQDSTWQYFDTLNRLICTAEFLRGKQNGLTYFYNTSKKQIEVSTFKDGKIHGLAIIIDTQINKTYVFKWKENILIQKDSF
jgi:antitoxin component YwqK of YwqJK toxin-antitoxin module